VGNAVSGRGFNLSGEQLAQLAVGSGGSTLADVAPTGVHTEGTSADTTALAHDKVFTASSAGAMRAGDPFDPITGYEDAQDLSHLDNMSADAAMGFADNAYEDRTYKWTGLEDPDDPDSEVTYLMRGGKEIPPTIQDANGEYRPNPMYWSKEFDLERPEGVPDYAQYVVNIHYRHGKTNANAGTPMLSPDGTPVHPSLHSVNTDGSVVEGVPWFAGNKLGNWVRLLPESRAQASALQPTIEGLSPYVNFLAHSPVQRAIDTMNLATEGVALPPQHEMSGLAERGVGGLFGSPKTDEFKDMTGQPGYKPPAEIPNDNLPWSRTDDVTGPESVAEFLGRMGATAEEIARMNFNRGNGMMFSHQYAISGIQDHDYKMTGSDPQNGMPHYGVWNPEPLHPQHNPDLPINPNGFMDAMEAGHHIPNGATLVRPGWAWVDEAGKAHFVPAPKGYSDLKAPPIPKPSDGAVGDE
jgi:broad specificity phosphatase PhoE